MRFHKVSAIVLRHYDFGEADKVVVLYSRNQGKLRAVARGARRMKSKYGSSMEPFSYNEMMLYKKEGAELYKITGCSTVNSYSYLRKDLDSFITASYIVELIDKITEDNEPHPEMFFMLNEVFSQMPDCDRDVIKWAFVVKLLSASGYKLCLDKCACCGITARRARDIVKFSSFQGGVICPRCESRDLNSVSVPWRYIDYLEDFESKAFTEIDTAGISQSHRKGLESIIGSYLSSHLSGELKTEKFIKQWEVLIS